MIIGIITARRGSKSISNKNLTLLGGRPLIDFTFDLAERCSSLERVFLTTDDLRVIELAQSGYSRIEVPFLRPPELAADTTGHVEVVNHLLAHLKNRLGIEPFGFVLFQPTSPFRDLEEVEEAIKLFKCGKHNSLLGAVPVMHHPADYVWRQQMDGPLVEVIERAPGVRRQELPPVYFISGALFICKCAWYRKKQRFYDRESYLFQMSKGTLLDIDTPFDLQLARGYLLAS